MDRPGRQHHPVGRHHLAIGEQHADRPAALEKDTVDGRVDPDSEVRAIEHRPQRGFGRGDPPSVASRQPGQLRIRRRTEQRSVDRAEFGLVGQLLGELEPRPRRGGIVPTPRPIQIRVAAQGDHRVDRRRTADPTTAPVDARRAAGGRCGHQRRERPVRHVERCEEVGAAQRSVEIACDKAWPGFNQCHLMRPVGRQTCREHTPGRTGSDDDRRPPLDWVG
jgi:hypothetical protein